LKLFLPSFKTVIEFLSNLENRLKILNIGKLEYISDSENIAFSIILKDKN
jgi:hypothetical protein